MDKNCFFAETQQGQIVVFRNEGSKNVKLVSSLKAEKLLRIKQLSNLRNQGFMLMRNDCQN